MVFGSTPISVSRQFRAFKTLYFIRISAFRKVQYNSLYGVEYSFCNATEYCCGNEHNLLAIIVALNHMN